MDVVRGNFERKVGVLCPKPRRVFQPFNDADGIRRSLFHPSHQADLNTSAAASNEILDIILTKDCYDGLDQQQVPGSQVSSSPPYFCGTPPSRSVNPLVHDARFLEEKHTSANNTSLTSSFLSPISPLSPSAGARKGGCGPKPAVRIEGFDCLNRDIPAVA